MDQDLLRYDLMNLLLTVHWEEYSSFRSHGLRELVFKCRDSVERKCAKVWRKMRSVLTVSDPDRALERNVNGSVVIANVNSVIGIRCPMGHAKIASQWCRSHGNKN